MKHCTFAQTHKPRLLTAIRACVRDMFKLMESDEKLFARVKEGMHTLDVLVIVTYVRWSKWPFHRRGIQLEAATLRDSAESARVAEIVSSNLTELLMRELNEASLEVLCSKLDAQALANAIQRLYMNKFTANAVMTEMLADAIKADLEQVFEKAVSNRFGRVSGNR
jgi:hypothetical protein